MKSLMDFLGLVIISIILLNCSGPEKEFDTKEFDTWETYSGDPTGTKYSSLDQINKGNVNQLRPLWTYRTGDMSEIPPSTIQCNPIIIKDRMFITTQKFKLVALDAATGDEIWVFDPDYKRGGHGVNRGVTYWTDGQEEFLFYVAGAYLYCVNASNGQLVASFGDNGKADLRSGLGRDVGSLLVTATTPGVIYNDLLILGSALGEGPRPSAPGHIRAFDVKTGKIRWIFHTIPHPGEFGYETWSEDSWKKTGGTNSWGGFTLDKQRGMVFCGTGSPSYDHWGGDRVGQNLFGNCILALDAATGERIWHYQVVHHDLWDYDIPCPPNLVTLNRSGKRIDAIAQPTKMGHLFVLDRETGEPIFPIAEVEVPMSEIQGEESWPTQPFPPKSLRYARQSFTSSDITNINPEANAYVKEKIKDWRLGDIFLPPGEQASAMLPQFNGGTDWGGAAFDPETNSLVVNCSNELEWISMVKSKPNPNLTTFQFGRDLYGALCSWCHFQGADAPSLHTLKDRDPAYSQGDAIQTMNTGRGLMPSFNSLSEMEKQAIVSYLWDEGHGTRIDTTAANFTLSAHTPYVATGHNEIKDHEGFPANKPPWGTLNSIDLNEGRIRWQVPLGTYPELESRGIGPTGTFNMGGPVVTAGGLVFIGAAMDERFHAYDKDTGELLWEFQMDAGGYATPSTYQVDGRQYVVIAAGGGGKPGTKPGDRYYCFGIPE
jgi:quinoprotein glucose dehydrogenase